MVWLSNMHVLYVLGNIHLNYVVGEENEVVLEKSPRWYGYLKMARKAFPECRLLSFSSAQIINNPLSLKISFDLFASDADTCFHLQ